MAGRILPIAIATVVGVSIGVATFDRELREQRRQRLQEEYDQYVEFSNTLHSTSLTTLVGKSLLLQL
jgi:hypothetical protein